MARDDTPTGAGRAFTPVPVRPRHDGWTPEKQSDFIEALADAACVTEACKHVGMSDVSAYALRRRADAYEFRAAWDSALELGIRRLADMALCRALRGVPRPIFYKGEQVGEWREYDERLTMFLLRYRDPVRFGPWLDRLDARQPPDGPALRLAWHAAKAEQQAWDEECGRLRPGDGDDSPEDRRDPISTRDGE
jgi:hypothetical protein